MPTSSPAARAALVAGLLTAVLAPRTADAQVYRVPERAAERTTPSNDQLRQRLLFGVDLLGGYDDSVAGDTGVGGGPGAPPVVADPGYLGMADLSLLYSRSKGDTEFALAARGGISSTTGNSLGPSERASLSLDGSTTWGRNTTVRFGNLISYDALYSPGEFDPIAGDVPVGELPTSTQSTGVLQRRSWANSTTLGLDQQIGRRGTAGVSYVFDYRDYLDESDPSSHSNGLGASYGHRFNRTTSLNASYDYTQGEFVGGVQVLNQRPLTTHTIEAGPQIVKRFSPSRSLILDFGGGATRVDTVSGEQQVISQFWSSYGHASARIDVSRTWALAGNFRRTATPLDGLTSEVYVSDTFGISLGGGVGSRTQLTFSGGLATGTQGSTAAVTSDYTSYMGAVQLGFRVLRNMSAVVNYSYYDYSFSGDEVLPAGVPPQFTRNAVRFGLSYSLPLTRESRAGRP